MDAPSCQECTTYETAYDALCNNANSFANYALTHQSPVVIMHLVLYDAVNRNKVSIH
jgi:hypothetical protein